MAEKPNTRDIVKASLAYGFASLFDSEVQYFRAFSREKQFSDVACLKADERERKEIFTFFQLGNFNRTFRY